MRMLRRKTWRTSRKTHWYIRVCWRWDAGHSRCEISDHPQRGTIMSTLKSHKIYKHKLEYHQQNNNSMVSWVWLVTPLQYTSTQRSTWCQSVSIPMISPKRNLLGVKPCSWTHNQLLKYHRETIKLHKLKSTLKIWRSKWRTEDLCRKNLKPTDKEIPPP